jgi:Domain of unknown function (DUF4412)
MKTAVSLTAALLIATFTAHADFSYTTTQKATGGQMAAMAAGQNQNTKFYLKGQKMKTENGDTATILDFDAQTITTVNNKQKTASVHKFSDIAAAGTDVNAKIDVKETGQKKVINGYNASELVMTIQMDSPAGAQMGKMQMEMAMWLSSDPPGVKELRAFYQKNMSRFPWAAMSAGQGNPGMQAAMAEMQRKLAEMNGVNVMEVMKMKAAGGSAAPAMPQMTPEQMAQMKAAMDRLQAQGGPGAAQAQQAMARMQAMQGGGAPGAGSGSLMEMTMESTDFSTSSIPDSVFAVPSSYKVDQK